jgi:hypothetical protein
MPSQFPNSPKLIKGALLTFDNALLAISPNIIVFQYNPEQLSHKLAGSFPEADRTKVKKETYRVADFPTESITDLKIILDATDQLEQGDPVAVARGISPAIAALEMMAFPLGTSQLGLRNLLRIGQSDSATVPPKQLPVVLFVWGPWRIVPVLVTAINVTELAFDPLLNPVHAEATISLEVISQDRLDKSSFAYGAYQWTQGNREVNAALNIKNTVQSAIGLLPF